MNRHTFAAVCALFLVAALTSAARAGPVVGPYSLSASALTGPQGTTVAIEVTPSVATLAQVVVTTPGPPDPRFTRVESKTFANVPVHDGVATVDVKQVDRGAYVSVQARVQTSVLRTSTTALLRPDLVVTDVGAPPQALVGAPFDVQADVAEINGDTGATATVSVVMGPSVLASTSVTVPPGSHVPVTLRDVAVTIDMPAELIVVVSDVTPAESVATNDWRKIVVEVTENEVVTPNVVLGSLGGYGVQMNGHVYAGVLPAPPGSMPDLEAKVKALEPQLVRIFFAEAQEAIPERMDSFIKTVVLAQEAGATINITYQTAANARNNPGKYMGDFAGVLDNLVRGHGATNLRWVTIQNEPNTTQVTLTQYDALYRALDAALVTRGLRDQIRFMGGDLVEFGSGPNPDQDAWWSYMAAHMTDILDAYSVHIYWNYWDIPRMYFRLEDVRRIVDQLPPEARKPLYVTEFGVRGILTLPDGTTIPQPGTWADGTPLARTNIAAFQQIWFAVAAAQMGYTGAVKWDGYWGKYDSSYKAAHYLIGPPDEGWPLFPAYHAFRLLLQTTAPGWQVLEVGPWADDDWKLNAANQPYDQPEKELAAYSGPDGQLTLFGLDSHGRNLNATGPLQSYSIGGLTAGTTFTLVVWNGDGAGVNSIAGTVVANGVGVARFSVPLQSAFALTTVPVS